MKPYTEEPPKWWSPQHSNVWVEGLDHASRTLLLRGEIYKIELRRVPPKNDQVRKREYLLKARNTLVRRGNDNSNNCRTKVWLHLSVKEVLWAFHEAPPHPTEYPVGEMEIRLGADIFLPAKYIRRWEWLSFPGPGSGGSPDPNISILVTKEITQVVQTLLALP